MKIRIKIILALFVTALFISAATFPTKIINGDQCIVTNSAYKGDEKLVYKIYYNWGLLWIPAGEATFDVSETNDAYEMKVVGKTYKSYESIFRVNDYFYSKVDKKTSLPQNFVRIVEEGNYRLYDSISFDQNRNTAMTFHGRTKDTTKPKMYRFNHCIQDLVSNMYKMRNIDFSSMKKGDQISQNILFDKDIIPLNIAYSGKEKKEIKDLGRFKTIKVMPSLVEGNVFKEGDHMSIWVSDDSNKIPLVIESPVSVGSIKAILKSHSGLKYNLTSKIND